MAASVRASALSVTQPCDHGQRGCQRRCGLLRSILLRGDVDRDTGIAEHRSERVGACAPCLVERWILMRDGVLLRMTNDEDRGRAAGRLRACDEGKAAGHGEGDHQDKVAHAVRFCHVVMARIPREQGTRETDLTDLP